MRSRAVSRAIRLAAVACAAALAAGLSQSAATPVVHAAGTGPVSKAAPAGPFATLLFSRTEMTAADNCVVNNTGIARLDTTVGPYLDSLGVTGTGTLVTSRTQLNATTCVHTRSSMTSSWTQASSLAANFGWSFVSHTATYPSNLAGLTPAQSQAETCGSAQAIVDHGLPGAHGMIAYPGAQDQPLALQTNYGAKCFAWGRRSGGNGTTAAVAGTTSPFWQFTQSVNGGACNVSTAACYTIPSTGNKRYQLPSRFINWVNAVGPDEWLTIQAYVLVRGKSPVYTNSPIRWDCSSANVRLHWTNDNERYCYQDWQAIVAAILGVPNIKVTDPLTVGVAFGRPATYP